MGDKTPENSLVGGQLEPLLRLPAEPAHYLGFEDLGIKIAAAGD